MSDGFGQAQISSCAALNRPYTTYLLTQDVVSEDTCMVPLARGITLDLGGHTITYGNGFAVGIPNAGFETCNAQVPANWDLSGAPGARCRPKVHYWENYELLLDLTRGSPQKIRSARTSIPANKTFSAFAWIKSAMENTATLRVLRASDGSEIAAKVSTGGAIERGFAIEVPFKLTAASDVIMEITVSGTGAAAVDQADIKAARSYGIAVSSYHDNTYFPDLPANQPQAAPNFTVKNGRIVQGAGHGVWSPAIKCDQPGLTIEGVEMHTNGINTSVVDAYWAGAPGIKIQKSTLSSDSLGVFNRMTICPLLNLARTKGNVTIMGSTLTGGAQQGIGIYRQLNEGSPSDTILISGNTIKNYGKVTNSYAIALTGCRNVTILDNIIAPTYGRGILLDTDSEQSKNINVEISGNTIDVQERRNHEYDDSGLQAAGIRLRSYTGGGNFNVRIHDNIIRTHTGPSLVGEANGITIQAKVNGENITIGPNNDIQSWSTDGNRKAYALLFQDVMPGSNVVVKNNTLTSNVSIARFGDYDGYDAHQIQLLSNLARKGTEPWPGGKFRTFIYGIDTGSQRGNDFLDNRFDGGAGPDDFEFVGSGDKDLTVSWYLTVRVQDMNGSPVGGAAVRFVDKDGMAKADVTDASGQVRRVLNQYQRSGSSVSKVSYYSPYTVFVESGSNRSQKTIDLRSSQTLDFKIAIEGDPKSPAAELWGRPRHVMR